MRDDDDGNLEFDAWIAVADASSSSSCAFLDFLKRRGATDVFVTHVLDGGALDADDRGVFARVSAACRDVADASRLPRAGNDGVPLRVRAHASSVARMRWARLNRCPWNDRVCDIIADVGSLDVMRFARTEGKIPWGVKTALNLARGNHLAVFRWCCEEKPQTPGPGGRTLDAHVEKVVGRKNHPRWRVPPEEWQEEHLVEWDRHASCVDDAEFRAWDVCAAAAEGGHLEFLEYAMHRVNWDHHMSAFAARAGQVRVLRWLRERGCPWDEDVCSYAARGSFETLQWLWNEGLVNIGNEETCAQAARGGCLETLQWCREKGFPWDFRTPTAAADGGHLEILKWATENGCSWEDTTGNDYGIACPMFAAAKRGHLHVLRWIREEVCDDDDVWDWPSICADAATGGHLRVLKFAREECKKDDDAVPWDFWTPFKAAQRGHQEVFEWVCEQSKGRFNLLPSARIAAQFGRAEILRYIVSKAPGRNYWNMLANDNYGRGYGRKSGFGVDVGRKWHKHVIALAVANGRLECAKFLLTRYAFKQKAELCKMAAAGNALPVLRWLVEEQNFPFDVRFCVGLLIRDADNWNEDTVGAIGDVEDFRAKRPEEWAVAQTLLDVANARRGPNEDALPSLASMYEDRMKKDVRKGKADEIRGYASFLCKLFQPASPRFVHEILDDREFPDVEDRAWDDDEGEIDDLDQRFSHTDDDDPPLYDGYRKEISMIMGYHETGDFDQLIEAAFEAALGPSPAILNDDGDKYKGSDQRSDYGYHDTSSDSEG